MGRRSAIRRGPKRPSTLGKGKPSATTGPPQPKRLILRFCLGFLSFTLLFALATSTETATRYLHEPLARLLALMSVPILSLFGEASAHGSFLAFEGFQASIVEACNGVLPTYIFFSAVLAFPSRWRAKGWGFLIGVPAIFLINFIRVVTLMILGAFRPDLFEQVHIYVWQALVITLSMAVWVYWAERFVRFDLRPSP